MDDKVSIKVHLNYKENQKYKTWWTQRLFLCKEKYRVDASFLSFNSHFPPKNVM